MPICFSWAMIMSCHLAYQSGPKARIRFHRSYEKRTGFREPSPHGIARSTYSSGSASREGIGSSTDSTPSIRASHLAVTQSQPRLKKAYPSGSVRYHRLSALTRLKNPVPSVSFLLPLPPQDVQAGTPHAFSLAASRERARISSASLRTLPGQSFAVYWPKRSISVPRGGGRGSQGSSSKSTCSRRTRRGAAEGMLMNSAARMSSREILEP